jgi:hypothetical protein
LDKYVTSEHFKYWLQNIKKKSVYLQLYFCLMNLLQNL